MRIRLKISVRGIAKANISISEAARRRDETLGATLQPVRSVLKKSNAGEARRHQAVLRRFVGEIFARESEILAAGHGQKQSVDGNEN
jgi:hypothetical protein